MVREVTIQELLPFAGRDVGAPLAVLDLFAGIGGMSIGFREAGFEVTGVDSNRNAARTFTANAIGQHLVRDLRSEDAVINVSVVVGGPPCRPWSSVNLQKRGRMHEDFDLLQRFFDHLDAIRPVLFIMENVPPLMNDPAYLQLLRDMEFRGYSVGARVVRYSDFGAATTRRRLITVGINDFRWPWHRFFSLLEEERQRALSQRKGVGTVRSAIGWLRDLEAGAVPDHEWSQLTTIDNYRNRYKSGSFGWRKLDWDLPAPSFGSVGKTYILHPDSWENERPARVISVREVLSLLGFPRDFSFPPGTPLTHRYRMAANAVSPIFARTCADTVRILLAAL